MEPVGAKRGGPQALVGIVIDNVLHVHRQCQAQHIERYLQFGLHNRVDARIEVLNQLPQASGQDFHGRVRYIVIVTDRANKVQKQRTYF